MELILGLSIAATAEDGTNYLFLYIFEVNAGSLRSYLAYIRLVLSCIFLVFYPFMSNKTAAEVILRCGVCTTFADKLSSF